MSINNPTAMPVSEAALLMSSRALALDAVLTGAAVASDDWLNEAVESIERAVESIKAAVCNRIDPELADHMSNYGDRKYGGVYHPASHR